MQSRTHQKHRREIGLVRYLVALGRVVAAVAPFAVLVTWPDVFSQPFPPDVGNAVDAFSFAPSVMGDPPSSVPDAGSVFKERPAEAVEHVQAF